MVQWHAGNTKFGLRNGHFRRSRDPKCSKFSHPLNFENVPTSLIQVREQTISEEFSFYDKEIHETFKMLFYL